MVPNCTNGYVVEMGGLIEQFKEFFRETAVKTEDAADKGFKRKAVRGERWQQI